MLLYPIGGRIRLGGRAGRAAGPAMRSIAAVGGAHRSRPEDGLACGPRAHLPGFFAVLRGTESPAIPADGLHTQP